MPESTTAPPHPDATLIDVEMGPYSLSVSTEFGPRVVSLRWHQGPELFAQLGDDVAIPSPGSGTYRFHGGHRLWAAPEIPVVTYAPDDHPCAVTIGDDEVSIRAPVDYAGLGKDVIVGLEGERLLVDHRLENGGTRPVPVAAWGITQFRLGGVALIPTGAGALDDPLQAVSSLVLWSYTNLADPRLSWRERVALVEANPGPRFKIGSGPNPGRIGYWIEKQLFTKEIVAAGAGTYADRGAVGQVFVDDSFCELESVGPVVSLEPGSSVSHREVWEVTECPDLATASERVARRTGP